MARNLDVRRRKGLVEVHAQAGVRDLLLVEQLEGRADAVDAAIALVVGGEEDRVYPEEALPA